MCLEDKKYDMFEEFIKVSAAKVMTDSTNLFVAAVDPDILWEAYYYNLPEWDRQRYNCNTCKSFIKKYGAAVVVKNDGQLVSVLWHENAGVPEFFKSAVAELKQLVESAGIKSVLIVNDNVLGRPITGEWTHLSIQVPSRFVNKSISKTAGQVIAEKTEEYRMLNRAFMDYSLDSIETAIELLSSETVYRGSQYLSMLEWFKNAAEIIRKSVFHNRNNLTWKLVAEAPAGFTHIKSSMVGSLLDDLQSGMSYRSAADRFTEKMDPSRYMRSQAAPTVGAIQQAEKVIQEMGLTASLERRYATFDELPAFIWRNSSKSVPTKEGVFGNITPKGKAIKNNDSILQPTTMTWSKFVRTVLPSALSIDAKVDNPSRFMALVTAQNPEAKNILKWDNPFSWYYHAGVDGEIRRRVEAAGGRYENNDIRCSLIWENYTDLDLHCITPNGSHIYFGNKRKDNGWLDVDMNVSRETMEPVENIRWAAGEAPNGCYKFYVKNYTDRSHKGTPFKVELQVGGQIYHYPGEPLFWNDRTSVFEFFYQDGRIEFLTGNPAASSAANDWNVEAGSFVRVNGIIASPETWSSCLKQPEHFFFLLQDCRDTTEGRGRGFFNEMLKPELREIRKTLEAYTAQASISGADNASACGLGFNRESDWDLTLRVNTDKTTRFIKIDRFD